MAKKTIIDSADSVLWRPEAKWAFPPHVSDGRVVHSVGDKVVVLWESTWNTGWIPFDDFSESDHRRLKNGTRIRRWSGLVDCVGQRKRVVAYRVVSG